MGIKLTIYSEGEENNICLTNHTIKKYGKNLDEPDGKNEYLSGPLLGIEFSGKVDVYDRSGEILELKKLAEWAKRTAHEKDVYRKAVIEFNDISGNEYDSITLEKTFVVKYEQSFDGEKGEGEFYILLRSLDHIDDVFGQSWSSGNIFIIPDAEIPLASPLSNTINTEYTIGPKTQEEYQEHLKELTLEQLISLEAGLEASLVLIKAMGKNTDKYTERSLQEKIDMVSSEIRKKSEKDQNKDFITLEQMKNLKWSKLHCGYKVEGTEKDSPIDDMSSVITKKHRNINQTDINKINSLFEKYQINTKKRICAFFAECSSETNYGNGFLETAGTKENPFVGDVTRTNLNKWFDNYTKYGSKYRGGGAIQLTWYDNYNSFKDWMKRKFDIEDSDIIDKGAEYIAMNYTWETAIFFWDKNNLNSKADNINTIDDIDKITKVVNSKMSTSEYKLRKDAYEYWIGNYNFPL